MEYIDWYYEKTTQKLKIFDTSKGSYRDWVDLVTDTHYCIADADYDRICASGREHLEQCLKNNDLEAAEQLFYRSGGTKDIDLFFDLPFFSENTKKCARIRDYVCFRTACLYSLRYESIKHNTDPEGEKRRLRMQGFTWGFTGHKENIPELEQIDWLLNGHKEAGVDILKQKMDFVKGGMVKIKQYYLETNKISEIRGASLLLDTVNQEKMDELIGQMHIKECLIYTGGGKIMGILPEKTGQDFCRELELLVERETVTAQSNFLSHSYELKRIIHDYQAIVDEIDLALEERQGFRWDFRIEPQVEEKISESVLIEKGYKKIKETVQEFCTSCRKRHAIVKRVYSLEMLCQSCLYKRLNGGRDAKHSIHERFFDYVEKRHGVVVPDYLKKVPCNKLEDIAEKNFIGIIYGDANNMSNQINNLTSSMMMRYFSQITSGTVTDIVFESLYRHLKGKPSFEVIAVGGDDIFLIVPGNHAYDIACTIGELFDQQFSNRSTGENNVTMSIGVCITHKNMPVQYSFDIAQKLLKSAKQKAWEERQEGTITGTIDWMVIENEMAGSADLKYQRRNQQDKPKKTFRPYTWQQAKDMKHFLHEIEKEKAFAFQLRQSWYQHTKSEAELFYEYQISRKSETNVCKALDHFAKSLGGQVEKSNIIYRQESYTPWLDAIELWDYVEGTE